MWGSHAELATEFLKYTPLLHRSLDASIASADKTTSGEAILIYWGTANLQNGRDQWPPLGPDIGTNIGHICGGCLPAVSCHLSLILLTFEQDTRPLVDKIDQSSGSRCSQRAKANSMGEWLV